MKLSSRFKELNEQDQQMILEKVDEMIEKALVSVSKLREEHVANKTRQCPCCESQSFRRHGKYNGIQRYICKECGTTFSDSTGGVLSWLKKPEKLKTYAGHMLAGHSIKKCAELTGIAYQTAFDWRHKLLSALNQQLDEVEFSGICESDEIFFAHSQKGQRKLDRPARKRGKAALIKKSKGINKDKVAVIITTDRSGKAHFQTATRGRIAKKDIKRALQGRFRKGSILCTDSHRSYTAFAKSEKIRHEKINSSKKQFKKGIYHVQHVNQKASELRQWLQPFKGVSTKYLQNYLNWYALQKKIKEGYNHSIALLVMALGNDFAWLDFKNIGVIYNILLD